MRCSVRCCRPAPTNGRGPERSPSSCSCRSSTSTARAQRRSRTNWERRWSGFAAGASRRRMQSRRRGRCRRGVRMAAVHFVADSLNYLIAGTLDRTDLTLGAFTRYGESDVDLLPLGNAAQERGHRAGAGPRTAARPSPSAVPVARRTTRRQPPAISSAIRPTARMALRRRWRCRIERLMRESERKRAPAECRTSTGSDRGQTR